MSTTFTNIGHAEKILLKLWEQCESEESCDVVLIAGTVEKKIPAHRYVLSAASEFFDGMFASSMRESVPIEVEMPSVDGDILQRVVEYCYTGRVVISEEIVVELHKTAHMLHFVNVVANCEKFLLEHLSPRNCLRVANLVDCSKTLLEEARCYSKENFLEVCEMSEFLDITAEQLSQLVASDDLCVRNEENVFNSLIRWIEHNRNERVKHFPELLKLLRMPLLERSFLIEQVKPICASTECLQIYMEAMEGHLSPGSVILSKSKLTKLRRSDQILMAISESKSSKKIFIHYYCPQQNAWKKWLKDVQYRERYGVAVMENYLFIVGGCYAAITRLNLRTMTLKQMTPLNEFRLYCRVAALNGILYVVGGWNTKKSLYSVEKWSPEKNKWDVVAPMSISRCDFGIAVLNGKLYVVGGFNSDCTPLNSAECYDPILNVWKIIKSMSEKLIAPGVAVANGLLYAVSSGRERTVERYDPETDQWTMMCSLRESLITFHCCTTLRDKVVVCYNDHIEEFDAAANEWKEIMSLKQPDDIFGIYSYADKLLTSEFVKN